MNDFFAAYTAAETVDAFEREAQPLKFPYLLGMLTPIKIRGSLGLRESAFQSASRSVQAFCRAYGHGQQTNRHTDRPRYSVCNSRPYLITAAMRPNNITSLYAYT